VLGFSALKAGLVMLPLAAGTMVSAGPAGVLAERLGGRYILAGGLSAFAGGLLWVMAVAGVGSGAATVLAPLFLMGLGAGCTFAPMAAEVMRNVPAGLSGAASGVNNALRQVGSVLAGAVIGAVLQARLAASVGEEARRRSLGLPPSLRGPFVHGFDHAGEHLDAGGRTPVRVPAGVPAEVADRVRTTAAGVFGHGFVDAMRPTMLVSVVVLGAGVLACLALRKAGAPSAGPHGLPITEEDLVGRHG
jgi:hypothetical protein